MAYYVGLDVHSKACTFVIQGADGTVVGQGEIPTTAAGFQQSCVAKFPIEPEPTGAATRRSECRLPIECRRPHEQFPPRRASWGRGGAPGPTSEVWALN